MRAMPRYFSHKSKESLEQEEVAAIRKPTAMRKLLVQRIRKTTMHGTRETIYTPRLTAIVKTKPGFPGHAIVSKVKYNR